MKKKKSGIQESTHPKEMRQHFRYLVWMLQRRMVLQEWTVLLCYCRDPKREKDGVVMHINTDPVYMRATIHVLPAMARNIWKIPQRPWYEMMEQLCHELCHIYTDPLYLPASDKFKNGSREKEEFREARERQTQRIAGAIASKIPESEYTPPFKK